jgi:hypothetical protein
VRGRSLKHSHVLEPTPAIELLQQSSVVAAEACLEIICYYGEDDSTYYVNTVQLLLSTALSCEEEGYAPVDVEAFWTPLCPLFVTLVAAGGVGSCFTAADAPLLAAGSLESAETVQAGGAARTSPVWRSTRGFSGAR